MDMWQWLSHRRWLSYCCSIFLDTHLNVRSIFRVESFWLYICGVLIISLCPSSKWISGEWLIVFVYVLRYRVIWISSFNTLPLLSSLLITLWSLSCFKLKLRSVVLLSITFLLLSFYLLFLCWLLSWYDRSLGKSQVVGSLPVMIVIAFQTDILRRSLQYALFLHTGSLPLPSFEPRSGIPLRRDRWSPNVAISIVPDAHLGEHLLLLFLLWGSNLRLFLSQFNLYDCLLDFGIRVQLLVVVEQLMNTVKLPTV